MSRLEDTYDLELAKVKALRMQAAATAIAGLALATCWGVAGNSSERNEARKVCTTEIKRLTAMITHD